MMERNFSRDYLLTFTALSGSFSSLLLLAPTVSTPRPTDATEDTAFPGALGVQGPGSGEGVGPFPQTFQQHSRAP